MDCMGNMLGGSSLDVPGLHAATGNCEVWVIDMHHSVNRQCFIELSIESRYERNNLSKSSSLYCGRIAYSFIECHITGLDYEIIGIMK